MLRLSRLGVALALSLPLVTLCPNPTAAQDPEPKIIALADGEEDPLTFSWVDKADGTLSTDNQLATVRHDVFAKTKWLFTDGNSLVIAQQSGDTLKEVFSTAQVSNQDRTLFVVHFLSKDRKFLVNGIVNRSPDDPKQGIANLTILETTDAGDAITTVLQQLLTFQ